MVVRRTIFCVTCVLVIEFLIWGVAPELTALKKADAKDCYYNLLVQGLRAGQLNLKKEPPPRLKQLANPYDPVANVPYTSEVGDLSYYQGKLYLYFGLTPALTLFWPYTVLTGHYLQDIYASLIFYITGFLAAAGLLYAIWRRYFPNVGIGMAMAGIFTMGIVLDAQAIEWVDGRVYEVALSSGFAFTMLALAAIWCALHKREQRARWLLLASLAYGLALGSRPSLLFGSIIILIPVVYVWRSEPVPRRRVQLLLATMGPIMAIGLGLMFYNARRFGNPFEFGYRYQLSILQQTSVHQFSPDYLWFNFRYYFWEPIQLRSHLPFLQPVPPWPQSSGHFGPGLYYGGILLATFPLVCLAGMALSPSRGKSTFDTLRYFALSLWVLFVSGALTLCFFLYANTRYELDFLPALILLAMIGILNFESDRPEFHPWRPLRWMWRLLLLYTIVVNVCGSFYAYAAANCFAGNQLFNQGLADEAARRYQTALMFNPQSPEAHAGLGNTCFEKENYDEAIFHYQKALEIKPDFEKAANNLGLTFLEAGRLDEAIAQYQKALLLNPQSAEMHKHLGDAFLGKGEFDLAIPQYQKSLEIKPDAPDARNNFACCLLAAGRVDEAIFQCKTAIELQPNFAEAYDNLGNAYRRKKMATEAIANYQKAIELQPLFATAQADLAWILATWPESSVRNGVEAVTLAEKANQLSQKQDLQALRTLAAAYAEVGRFIDAESAASEALKLVDTQSETGLAKELETEIKLYHNHSPCRSIGD